METPAVYNTNKGVMSPKDRVKALNAMLQTDKAKKQFEDVLKENAPSFMASIIDLYNGDTYLQKCEPQQVIMEALKGAVLKLPMNKQLGFAYIVPYKGSATFQIGYKGLIQLAMRTGQYKYINADKVYEGELRKVTKLTGEIDFSGEKTSDTVVGYFAYIELLNGFAKTLYMTKDAVTAHAKRFSASFNASSSPWKTDFDAMAIKTVLRNLLGHYGYLSIEMITAISNDSDGDAVKEAKDEALSNENSELVDFEDMSQQQAEEQRDDEQSSGELPLEDQPKPNF